MSTIWVNDRRGRLQVSRRGDVTGWEQIVFHPNTADASLGFVISEHGTWIPGVFDSKEAACAAFDIAGVALFNLRDRVSKARGPEAMITIDDVQQMVTNHA